MSTFLFPEIDIIDYETAYAKLFEFSACSNVVKCDDKVAPTIVTESKEPKLRYFDLPLDALRHLPISMPVPKRLKK